MVTLSVLTSLLLNIVSSIGVIIVNKRLVFMEAHFEFSTMLTIIHFLLTFLGCVFFAYGLGLFRPKKLAVRRVLPISCAFCGYVLFNNLSLLTNSVSVYQILKVLCTPVIVLIEWAYYGKREEWRTLLSLVPICAGVGITFYTDLNVSIIGTLWAIFAIFANSLYTVWGKTKQVELGVKPMQLLMYQAPLSVVILSFVAVPLDGSEKLATYEVTFTTIWTVLLSCVFAFGVNFSFFFFVGKTSPLTMNVVGYLKTSLIFLFDFIFVSADMGPQKVLGIFLTLLGLAGYSFSKTMSRSPSSPMGQRHSRSDSLNDHQGAIEVRVTTV
ncbi:hypothetical protein JKF63_03056 [Porcisia hertigi]|uniref:Sugar phosphate transporter domain-containing protein n=1 Tax=Porcisia hertigi TaxID=2761500 RepID=A0A836IE85_9TRYP|nr:hypothetical protein JKF63_03056 [Porcisia hertigi]